MHSFVLILHGIVSCAILVLALFALWRSLSGLIARGGWLPADEKARRFLPVALDIELVLGLVLWATLSPSAMSAFTPSAPDGLLFKAMIHPIAGLVAIALAHIGSVKTRRLKTPREKFRTMGLFYVIVLVIIVAQAPFHG